MVRAKKIQRLGDIVNATLERVDASGRRHGARVVNAWSEVAGPEIARHTQGFALRNNQEMVVFVDSPVWANELALMAGDLVFRLNEHLGDETVKTLRFTVSKKVAEERSWEASLSSTGEEYMPDEVAPEHLSDVERMQVEHVASVVADPELRELALRVMIKDLEIKKGARNAASKGGSSTNDTRSPHGG